jgi:hypothetical protein
MLSGRDGHDIASKLGCDGPEQGRHIKFKFYLNGILFRYGVSHDAKKENQYHIARELGISVTQAKQLAVCNMSADEFLETSRRFNEPDPELDSLK